MPVVPSRIILRYWDFHKGVLVRVVEGDRKQFAMFSFTLLLSVSTGLWTVHCKPQHKMG